MCGFVDNVGRLLTATVPADAALVQLLRTVVAGVGARTGLTYDAIDDLRLAVQEAAGQVLAVSTESAALTLTVDVIDDGLELQLSTDAALGDWPPPAVERSLPWAILTTLVERVTLGGSNGDAWLRLRTAGGATQATPSRSVGPDGSA
jgi:serine/threonine-protein kinase RsbW